MNLRLADAGGRADEYKTIATHLAFGVDGSFKGIDYRGLHPLGKHPDRYGRWRLHEPERLRRAGRFRQVRSVCAPGNSKDVLAPAVLHNQFSETKSKIDMFQASGSTEVFKLPAGPAGTRCRLHQQKYSEAPDAFSQGQNKQQPDFTDAIVGGGAGALPIDATRTNWGAYGELLLPVLKNMDLTVSAVTTTSAP
jgi:iron complex outermembrane receptor protein